MPKPVYVRNDWSPESDRIPYHYLDPQPFKAKLTLLLQRGGCTRDMYDRWLEMYNEKRAEQHSANSAAGRVRVLWRPIIKKMERELASALSSIVYFKAKGEEQHCEANRVYAEVLRSTKRKIKRHFIVQGISPKMAAQQLGRSSTQWVEFVPRSKREEVQALFFALPFRKYGKLKHPFQVPPAHQLPETSETSHTGDEHNADTET